VIDIENLTIAQARELASKFSYLSNPVSAPTAPSSDPIPVVVCTDKRSVVFGMTRDANARPIYLTDARMCLYWSADVGGVFGLSEKGPTKGCKVSATSPSVSLEGITAVFSVSAAAAVAWSSAPVQGRN
jgi:hypothetical protein